MLAPVRSPLGAPGVFALPEVQAPSLHPQRMDVCAFVGVAPRGPARVPVVDNSAWPGGYRRVSDLARPLRRSVPVLVRSFDEYLHHFGAFEGPGLLPQAVASYFEQGGRLAWVVRIVPNRLAPFDDRCAQGVLSGLFTAPLPFVARSEGSWGNGLRVAISLGSTALAFTLDAGQLLIDPRTALQVGSTLRLSDADGHATLSVCTGLRRVRDASRARERLLVELSVAPPNPPARLALVEAALTIDDGLGRSEQFDHLALVADHPQSLANVLCERSTLVWPHRDWAASTLTPADPQLDLASARSRPFSGGVDAWEQLLADDFFDASWSAAEDEPGDGIAALTAIPSVTQIVLPDLYLPAQWAGPDRIAAVPAGTAGAEFGACVDIAPIAAIDNSPPSALTGLLLDPRTQAGLGAIIARQQRVVDFCEQTQNQIALLDVPPGLSQARIEYWRAQFDSRWAAAYHPWLVPTRRRFEAIDDDRTEQRRMPPSAVAAGIIARRELERGLQFGPANEIARQIIHLAESQPAGRADALHPLHINCFVREPQGIALIAARTLSTERDWRQLSVRRLMLMLRRTLLVEMQWAVFEPNGPRLWRDIRTAVESLLRQLFRAGAFAGRSEAESFFVRVHTEDARLQRGELLVEIGVAPAEPLEFILVRLRRDGDGTLNLED